MARGFHRLGARILKRKPHSNVVRQLASAGQAVSRPNQEIRFQSLTGVLVLFLLLAGCGPSTKIPSLNPPALWSDGMESGDLSAWSSPDLSGSPGGAVLSTGIAVAGASQDVAHSGNYSAKLAITTPNFPDSGVRLFRWLEPQTFPQLYYSVWYYFPQRYILTGTPSWWNVFQWKSKHVVAGVESTDTFFNLIVGQRATGEMYFYLRGENTNSAYDQNLLNIPIGRWIHIEAFYKCDGSGAGQVAFWQDGTLLWDIQTVSTRYVDGDCQWSVNNYSNGLTPNIATIYVDDAVISTARAGASAPRR